MTNTKKDLINKLKDKNKKLTKEGVKSQWDRWVNSQIN